MLLAMSGDPKTHESDAIVCHTKCRIPQRLSSARQRSGKSNSNEVKNDGSKGRSYLGEVRPKSANRVSDGLGDSRSSRLEREKHYPTHKNPVPLNKKAPNEKLHGASTNKVGKHVITVPFKQRAISKSNNQNKLINLPDQETIKKYEDLEIKQDFSDRSPLSNDIQEVFVVYNEGDSVTSKNDKVIKLTNTQFEGMKNELNDRKNTIVELYSSLRSTKEKLSALGQSANLPSTSDLHVTNETSVSEPSHLLKMWTETKCQKIEVKEDTKNTVTIDMKRLRDIPAKLVATCEHALDARKNVIEWLENLKNCDKGCPKSTLGKKINEFIAENEMLSSSLKNQENEFLKEISEIIRTCWNEAISVQLRNEGLIYELSELNALNANLKKQITNFEHQKTHINKAKIEGLEAELKQEKMKRMTMKDRLSRAEGQIKIGEERATLLESALNEAQAQTRTLERTKQQLHEKNQQLQEEFNSELEKLKVSMKQNTIHLEEIALAKEKLQEEKEELKAKLEELSKHYEESMSNMKQEINKNIINLIDVEKKYNDEIEIKKNLQTTIESQCAHLVESELRNKEMLQKLQEKESALGELVIYKSKFEEVQKALDETTVEMEKCKKHMAEYMDTIHKLEQNLNKSYEVENRLNEDIHKKTEYIKELEIKKQLLIEQSHENESKMEMYEDQLLSLKKHITKLKEHFGEFENLNNLQEMINKENATLNDTKRQNNELLQEIENKKGILNQLTDSIDEKDDLIKEKENLLQKLSEKQGEQEDLLKLNRQIFEKNAEIEALLSSLESRKEQIDQLEKIVLTLEDRNRKACIQKRRDHDKICALEKRVFEYEYCVRHKIKNVPSNDLDNIIKILEDELGGQLTPTIESPIINTDHNYFNNINHNENIIADRGEYKDYDKKQSFTQIEKDKAATKHVRVTCEQKNINSNNNDGKQNAEYLARKHAKTNIDAQKWTASTDSKSTFIPVSHFNNDTFLCVKEKRPLMLSKEKLRKLHYIEMNQARDQKIYKMFKNSSHQL
ncbi:interaptin-like [Vanessa cardui]|uniref:interaptin-like n=1 Tax=Vanessa cardui TaxID=171605 RepID=UPI001F148467|nr:interaptin-like [Vanessa cardui]